MKNSPPVEMSVSHNHLALSNILVGSVIDGLDCTMFDVLRCNLLDDQIRTCDMQGTLKIDGDLPSWLFVTLHLAVRSRLSVLHELAHEAVRFGPSNGRCHPPSFELTGRNWPTVILDGGGASQPILITLLSVKICILPQVAVLWLMNWLAGFASTRCEGGSTIPIADAGGHDRPR